MLHYGMYSSRATQTLIHYRDYRGVYKVVIFRDRVSPCAASNKVIVMGPKTPLGASGIISRQACPLIICKSTTTNVDLFASSQAAGACNRHHDNGYK